LHSPENDMKTLKKLVRISSAVVRITIGIGGAVVIFLALKDHAEQRGSQKPDLRDMH